MAIKNKTKACWTCRKWSSAGRDLKIDIGYGGYRVIPVGTCSYMNGAIVFGNQATCGSYETAK